MNSQPRTRKPRLEAVSVTAEREPQPAEDTVTGEFRHLPLTQLIVNPRNGRKELRGIDELAATIREVGVLEPLTVRPHDGDTFQICFGHRRFAAATKAGLTVVPCLIRALDDAQLLKEGLIENLHNDELTYLEEAEQLAELMDLQSLTIQELANSVGRTPTHVKDRLSLLGLPGKARTALETKVITYSTALALTEIVDYPEAIDDLVDVQHGVDPDELKDTIRRVGIERDCQRLRDEANTRGLRLVEDEPRGLGYVYVAELDELTPGQQRAHARQSCHAVYLDIGLGRPRLVSLCSTPDRHRPAAPAPAPEEPTGSDQGEVSVRRVASEDDPAAVTEGQGDSDTDYARRVEVERVQARQAAAAELERRVQEEAKNRRRVAAQRRTFLSELPQKRTPKRAEVTLFIYRAVLEKASQMTMGWVGKILGLEPVNRRFGAPDWQTPVLNYAVQSSDQMLRVILLVSCHWAEEHVTQYASGYDAAVVRYLELLTNLGYAPDPYETEQVAAHREAIEQANRRADEIRAAAENDTAQQETENSSGDAQEDGGQDAGEPSGDVDAGTTAGETSDAPAVNT